MYFDRMGFAQASRSTPAERLLSIRIRTALAVALVLGLGAGPLAPAPALAATPRVQVTVSQLPGPNVKALEGALLGLPSPDATAALVRVGGHGSWHAGAGVHDLESGRKALEGARFRAGSITKVVTSVIVLQLAAEGRVDLDCTVQRYLPNLLTDAFQPITVQQLLTFTSGLQPGSSLGPENAEGYENRFRTLTPKDVVAASVAKGPYQGPGEGLGRKQRYGNIDYTVLGLLIEKITGDSYAHQAQVRVFRTAGMWHTFFPDGPDPRIHGAHNQGYQKLADGTVVDATEWNMSDRWAAGDMISATADPEKFLFALFRGELVPQPLLDKEMFTVPDIEGAVMSAGLQRFEPGGGQILWLKTGERPGYSTLIAATRAGCQRPLSSVAGMRWRAVSSR